MHRPLLALTVLFAQALAEDWRVVRSSQDARLLAPARRALEQAPDDATALRRLLGLAPLPKLVAHYRALSQAHPERYAYAEILGHLLRRAGADKDALLEYRRAAALDDSQPAPHEAAAQLHRAASRFPEAVDSLGAALQRERRPARRRRLVRAMIEAATATDVVGRALDPLVGLVRDDPDVLGTEVARLLIDAGRGDEAAALLEQILSRPQVRGTERAKAARLLGLARAGDARADEAFALALGALPRDHWMRREILLEWAAAARGRDDLRALARMLHARRGGFDEAVTLATILDELGDAGRAVESYRAALRKRPWDTTVRQRLIALLDRVGRDGEALAEHRRLSAAAPGDPRFALDLAERLWNGGHRARALALAQRTGRAFASDETVHARLATIYARWDRADLAAAETEGLARIQPSEEHLTALGDLYYRRGDKARAKTTWRRLLRALRPRERALRILGDVLTEHDELDEALDAYRQALRIAPSEAEVHRSLGRLHERARRFAEAALSYQRALAVGTTPRDQDARAETRTRIVSLWERAKRLHDELGELRRRFERPTTTDSDAGHLLAEAYLRIGQAAAAERTYRTLLQRQPDDADVLLALLRLYQAEHRLPEAVDVLARLAVLRPAQRRDMAWQMADLLLAAGREREALGEARRALEAGPDTDGQRRMAALLERVGDSAGAQDALLRALALDAASQDAAFTLVRLQLREGRQEQAAGVLRRLLVTTTSEDVLARAAPRAIDLAERAGSLDVLWRELLPRAAENRPAIRRILVEMAARFLPALARRNAAAAKPAGIYRIGGTALRPLLEALSEPDPALHDLVLDVLGQLEAAELTGPLLAMAKRTAVDPQGPRVVALRARAIRIAARHVDSTHVKDLAALLAGREGAVREAAAFALATIGDPHAARVLAPALDDERPAVQAMACLGMARGNSARDSRWAELASDPRRDPSTRAACALALGAADPLTAGDLALLLDMASQGGEPGEAAAAALGTLAAPSAVRPLVVAWLSSPDSHARIARWALARVARRQGRAPLTWPRDWVARSGHVPGERLVAETIRAQADGPPDASESALVPLAFPPHGPALTLGVEEALLRPRDAVLRTLARLAAQHSRADPDAQPLADAAADASRPIVARLCAHRDPRVRADAASLLGAIGGQEAVAPLASALHDHDARVRASAGAAAARIASRHPETGALLRPSLRAGLALTDWPTRLAVARALRDPDDVTPLLQDESPFVREVAVTTLSSLGGRAARDALRCALLDPVPEVRAAAHRAVHAEDPRAPSPQVSHPRP